jgi:hypothetical protein
MGEMKKLLLAAALVCAALGTNIAFAAEPAYTEPILLTSCGQSADVLMMKTLLSKDSLNFAYLPQAAAADIAGKGSIMVVVGGSSKGLGAAKISEADETTRITALLDSAQSAGIPVIAVHMGGLSRRGALSDPFNLLGASRASHIIVVKGGNEDGFFTKIAAENSVPLDTLKNALEIGSLMKRIYAPKTE